MRWRTRNIRTLFFFSSPVSRRIVRVGRFGNVLRFGPEKGDGNRRISLLVHAQQQLQQSKSKRKDVREQTSPNVGSSRLERRRSPNRVRKIHARSIFISFIYFFILAITKRRSRAARATLPYKSEWKNGRATRATTSSRRSINPFPAAIRRSIASPSIRPND